MISAERHKRPFIFLSDEVMKAVDAVTKEIRYPMG